MSRHCDVPQSMVKREAVEKEQALRVTWRGNYNGAEKMRAQQIWRDKNPKPKPPRFLDRICLDTPGKGVTRVIPAINYPKSYETEAQFVLRLFKKYRKHYKGVDDVNITNMRPVERNGATRESLGLYDGLWAEEEGRYQYLDARKRIIPEKKYDWPMTNHWDYGWHVGRKMRQFPIPKAGRIRTIQDQFYRNNSAFNPPFEDAGLSMYMRNVNVKPK